MKLVLRAALLAAALAAILSGGTAVHAQTYPTRPISFVVPYTVGGNGAQSSSSAKMIQVADDDDGGDNDSSQTDTNSDDNADASSSDSDTLSVINGINDFLGEMNKNMDQQIEEREIERARQEQFYDRLYGRNR